MAIVELKRPDIETNMQGGVDFSFSKDAASKLYQMMSNYLYSDKEYAVVSELSANAVDAHALVNKKDVPIKVQLPTRFDPEFVVRDFGPGLSEDEVYRFLTSYGESSKGSSNEQIGFWGIGSKSPAAVSDSWSIISHHGGKKKHFEVFVTSEGIPTLKKVFEAASDETGLEVRVPIASSNEYQWKSAAQRAYKHYHIKPECPQLRAQDYPAPPDYKMMGDGWKRGQRASGGNLVVTMREYKLDWAKIKEQIPFDSPIVNLFYSGFNGFDFFFGVGQIDLSISREQVQYNKKTTDAIILRMTEAYDEVARRFKADISKATNSIEYRKVLADWYTHENIGTTFISHMIQGNPYNITKIPQDISSIVANNVDENKVQVVYGHKVRSMKSRGALVPSNAVRKVSIWNSASQSYDYGLSLSIADLDNIVLVIRDVKDPHSRIKHSGDSRKYYVVMEKNVFPSELKTVLASSFDRPPRVAREKREKITDFYILEGNRFLKATKDNMDAARSKPSYCVPIVNATSSAMNPEVHKEKPTFLRKAGYVTIGYKGDKPKGIKTPDAALKDMFDRMSNNKNIVEERKNANLRHMTGVIRYHLPSIYAIRGLVDSPKFNELTKELIPLRDYYAQYGCLPKEYVSPLFHQWVALCELMGVDPNVSGVVDVTSVVGALNKRYPMLRYVSSSWYDVNQDVVDYIKMVDKYI